MQLSILQLNMWAGTHFPAIKDFLENHDFDILCLQEITGPNTHVGNIDCTEDQYEKFKQLLGDKYDNAFSLDVRFTSDPVNSFEGNAIFYKKHLHLLNAKRIILYDGVNPFPSDAHGFEEVPRAFLDCVLQKDDKTFDVITTHLAWSPTPEERPHQTKQNTKLLEYVSTLKNPFILAGDFNLTPDQPSVVALETYAKNLTKDYGVSNTLDPVLHKAWPQIQPGFAVDYIFVSPDIHVKSFKALDDIHMSDHIGLSAIVEI